MIDNLYFISGDNLIVLFVAIYLACFAVPTGAMFFIISGAALAENIESFGSVILVTFLAAILGDFSSFLVGNLLGHRIVNYNWYKKNQKKNRRFFLKFGLFSIFLTKFFLPGLGPFLNYYAGITKVKWKLFLVLMISGEFFYALIYPSIGYFFRDTWRNIYYIITDSSIVIVVSVIVCYLIYRLWYLKFSGDLVERG